MIAVGNALQMTPEEIPAATGASKIPTCSLTALVAIPNLRIVRRHPPYRLAEERADDKNGNQAPTAYGAAIVDPAATVAVVAIVGNFAGIAVAATLG